MKKTATTSEKPKKKAKKKTTKSKYDTPAKLVAFLGFLAQSGNVRKAAAKAKLSPNTVYQEKAASEEFKKAYEQALNIAVDAIEGNAIERAMNGIRKAVYKGNKRVGTETEFNDTLTMFILKTRRRETYGDGVKHFTDPDQPLEFKDIGLAGAMAEVASIFTAAGLSPPTPSRPHDVGEHSPVDTAARPADTST